jgi:hypothetical protein
MVGYMDSMSAFVRGERARARGVKQMVFDWAKAAELIRERKPRRASAGLRGDWEYTGGLIYTADGIPAEDDTYVYLSSNWATPELDMDGDIIECWTAQSDTPGWDSDTYWPPEAKAILGQG